MTNEHKDALTGLCKVEIKRWKQASESNPNMRYMVELMEVALAALTAQPVSIKNTDFESALTLLNDVLDDCGDSDRGLLLALSRMGIEVQE